jgi:N-formylglutamate deformylase
MNADRHHGTSGTVQQDGGRSEAKTRRESYALERGDSPLIIDVPHAGTRLLPGLAARLTPAANALPDTDWHVDRLYQFAGGAGATTMIAAHSRYVVDLNRDPSGVSLYPGADVTELVPTRTFANEAIYREGKAPDAAEIDERRAAYFDAYHAALFAEVERVRARHGFAVLLDGHSIRAAVPRFFAGYLPDLNLGTAGGTSCAPDLQALTVEVLAAASGFSHVVNARFKGGYVTRHYGKPARGVHSLQLELAQRCYMDEAPPYRWDAARAAALCAVLTRLVDRLLAWHPEQRA